ncbi:hypothetical protein BH10BAC5_BH10BAC5_29150 [soil metagenome]
MNLKSELEKIESMLGISFSRSENIYSLNLMNLKNKTPVSIEIDFESETVCLVSVYTNNCHLQLQNCSRLIVSSMLEEFIFVSEAGNFISGMIISKQGDCSLYSNVNRNILSTDFSGLTSEKLLSAVALSVTEMDISS